MKYSTFWEAHNNENISRQFQFVSVDKDSSYFNSRLATSKNISYDMKVYSQLDICGCSSIKRKHTNALSIFFHYILTSAKTPHS